MTNCQDCLAEDKAWVVAYGNDEDLKDGACVKIPTDQEINEEVCVHKRGEPYPCIAGKQDNVDNPIMYTHSAYSHCNNPEETGGACKNKGCPPEQHTAMPIIYDSDLAPASCDGRMCAADIPCLADWKGNHYCRQAISDDQKECPDGVDSRCYCPPPTIDCSPEIMCSSCLAEGKVWVHPDSTDPDLKYSACVKIPNDKTVDECRHKPGEPYQCIAGLDENNNYYSLTDNSYCNNPEDTGGDCKYRGCPGSSPAPAPAPPTPAPPTPAPPTPTPPTPTPPTPAPPTPAPPTPAPPTPKPGTVGTCSDVPSSTDPAHPNAGIPCTSDAECNGFIARDGYIAKQPQQAVDNQQGYYHTCENGKCSNNELQSCSTFQDCPYNLVEFCAGPPEDPRPEDSCSHWTSEDACKWDGAKCVPHYSFGTCDLSKEYPTPDYNCITDNEGNPQCVAVSRGSFSDKSTCDEKCGEEKSRHHYCNFGTFCAGKGTRCKTWLTCAKSMGPAGELFGIYSHFHKTGDCFQKTDWNDYCTQNGISVDKCVVPAGEC